MKRNTILFLYFCLFAVFFTSCIEENLQDCQKAEKSLSLELLVSSSIQTRGAGYGVTRATEPGDDDWYDGLVDNNGNVIVPYNENKITTVDVFFYRGETQVWYPIDVAYSESSKKAIIPVRTIDEGYLDQTYDIYVVVNSPFARSEMTGKTLSDLREMVLNTDFSATNRIQAQPQFVMDGSLTGQPVSYATPDIGTVQMRRAAAKIRVRILKGSAIDDLLDYNGNGIPDFNEGIDGSTGATPLVSVKNYNEQGALLQGGSIKQAGITSDGDNDYRVANLLRPGKPQFAGISTPYPIYSYPNDWSNWTGDANDNRDNETYIMLRIPLYVGPKTPGMLPPDISQFTYFYYRVPVNSQRPDGPQNEDEKKFYRLDRNHLYDIQVTINQLGGTQENPVTLPGNYVIRDWTTQNIYADITAEHYLFVTPQITRMQNTATTVLSYSSSKLPVTISNIQASYTYTDAATGQTITTPYNPPNVTVEIDQPTQGKIRVTSPIPNNNVPKDISFTVSNGITTLNQIVRITQYPPNYITDQQGVRSNLRSQLDPAHNNRSMYITTASAPDGNSIIGFPPDANGYTVNSAEVANMISPSFMSASQLGATSTMGYNSARTNCYNYWEETIINGVTVRYDDWRLPTEAEIRLLDQMQHDPNSAVKIVMRGNYYWDAYNGNNAYRMSAPITNSGSPTSAHVRCVRDVKN